MPQTYHRQRYGRIFRCGDLPVAVRMVYRVARACRIPVMGCGGVETARDVIEMMMAGATAVQVGAANLRNPFMPARRSSRHCPAKWSGWGSNGCPILSAS